MEKNTQTQNIDRSIFSSSVFGFPISKNEHPYEKETKYKLVSWGPITAICSTASKNAPYYCTILTQHVDEKYTTKKVFQKYLAIANQVF